MVFGLGSLDFNLLFLQFANKKIKKSIYHTICPINKFGLIFLWRVTNVAMPQKWKK